MQKLDDILARVTEYGFSFLMFKLGLSFFRDLEYEFAAFCFRFTDEHPIANLLLGEIYCKGFGVPKNIEKSIEHFIKSANYIAAPMYHLFSLYYNGKPGLEKDLSEAYKWLLLIRTDDIDALEKELRHIEQELHKDAIKEGQKWATDWIENNRDWGYWEPYPKLADILRPVNK